MKALTICQPYPHLILTGEKPVENRHWLTRHSGALILHAGKSRAWMGAGFDESDAEDDGYPLVFGALVGRVELVACVRLGDILAGQWDQRFPKLISRNHCGGPWCWILDKPRRFKKPVPYTGQQRLFDVPDELIAGLELEPAP